MNALEDQLIRLLSEFLGADAGTIRADFAASIDANAVHGSDAAETAAVEIAFFFAGMNLHAR